MKKLLLTLLISLNLAMPAHAGVGLSIASIGGAAAGVVGGIIIVPSITVGVMDIYDVFTTPLEESPRTGGVLAIAMFFLLDGEKNSENNLVQVDALNDIEALISANIYTETEGNDLKSEWRAFESYLSESEGEFAIKPKQIQGMSPEEVVATIQSRVGDRKLLAEYLASKMGVQVQ